MPEQRLTLTEKDMLSSVISGITLDVSTRKEEDRVIRGAVMRKLLLGRYSIPLHPHGLRLRGAKVVHGLDLRDVTGNLRVSLTDCSVSTIQLASRGYISNLSLVQVQLVPNSARGYISFVRRIAKNPTALTVALFIFLVIKVLYVALGDIPTALEVFDTSSLTTVIVGGLLSGIPLVFASLLAVTISLMVTKWFSRRMLLALFTASGLACSFLTPWTVTLASVIAGLLAAWVIWMMNRKRSESKHRTQLMRAFLAFVVCAWLVLAGPEIMAALWLPHQQLTLATDAPFPSPRVGYVLNDTNGLVTLLHTGDRRILFIPASYVIARYMCTDTKLAGAWPFMSHPTIWSEFSLSAPHSTNDCSPKG
jgi:hypothetical protein